MVALMRFQILGSLLNQQCIVLEHPLIKDFIGLMKNVIGNEVTREEMGNFISKLESLKNSL